MLHLPLPLQLYISDRLLEIGFCYIGQAGLKLTILLPQPSECEDYRYALSCLAHAIYIHSRVYVCACMYQLKGSSLKKSRIILMSLTCHCRPRLSTELPFWTLPSSVPSFLISLYT